MGRGGKWVSENLKLKRQLNRSEQPSTKMSNEQTRNTNTRSVLQWMWRDRQKETRERQPCKNRTGTHTHTE